MASRAKGDEEVWHRLVQRMVDITSKHGLVVVVQLVRESKLPKEEVFAAMDAAADRGDIETVELGPLQMRPADKPLAWKRGGKVIAFIRLLRSASGQRSKETKASAVATAKAEIPFHEAVLAAARAAQKEGGEKRVFGEHKVFISAVYDQMKRLNPRLTVDAFKKDLLASQLRGEVNLSRADMVEAMPRESVVRSATDRDGMTYHFVRMGG